VEYVLLAAGLAAGALAGILLGVRRERARLAGAGKTAEEVLRRAEEEVGRRRKEEEIRLRDESVRRREELNRDLESRRSEIRDLESRLERRTQSLDDKLEALARRETALEGRAQATERRESALEKKEEEANRLVAEQTERLRQISGLSREEATQLLFQRLEEESAQEISTRLERAQERLREEEVALAQRVLSLAIQRLAVSHTQEATVYALEIPNDDMKGRIIGREGRNVRAFEKETGVDLVVDDTPGVVVISSFDPVRREVARRSLEKLIADGRIHPTRIEEIVAETREATEKGIEDTGRRTLAEIGLRNLHPRLVQLLGRLKYRTSYGQNVLRHSIECAYLASTMAAELGLDAELARRCGLLHDIGKAVSHEVEGTHPMVGADLARRHGETKIVVNAIAAHHEDVPYGSTYAVLTQVADAISASRPGARRDSIERYLQRLRALEEVAGSFAGVDQVYAIQAGREVRVLVDAGRVDDAEAVRIARDIARRIEGELEYPGEVKVTLLREKRIVEYAR